MGNVRVYKIKDGKIPKWNKNLVIDINADPRNQKHWYHTGQILIGELKEEPEGPQAVRSCLFKLYTLRKEKQARQSCIDINADHKNRKLLYHIWQALIRELNREPEGTQAGYPSI